MAGTITVSEETFGSIRKVVFSWLTHTDGTASATATTKAYSGELLSVLLTPGGTTPDDQYDVTLSDGTHDLLAGQGADCSNAHTVVLQNNLLPVANDTMALAIANGGSAKNGTVTVYIR